MESPIMLDPEAVTDAFSTGYDYQHESYPAPPSCPYSEGSQEAAAFWNGAHSAWYDCEYKYNPAAQR